MKKYLSLLMSSILFLVVCMLPVPGPAEAAAGPVKPAITAQPVRERADIKLNYVDLDENKKEILDEVMCDYISEEVVRLMDADVDYSIGDWFEKGTHTYVFFEKKIPGNLIYSACGYAVKADGTYAYFEISSPVPLTEEVVDQKISSSFLSPVQVYEQLC